MTEELQELIKIAGSFGILGSITFVLINAKIIIDVIFKIDDHSKKEREKYKKEIIKEYEKERKKDNG